MPRVEPKRSAELPFSAVGMLWMVFDNQKEYLGSGALIDPQFVLTCAHNLISMQAKTRAKPKAVSVRFYPGWNGGEPEDNTPGGYSASCAFYPLEHTKNERTIWDIGLVCLSQPCQPKNPANALKPFFKMQVYAWETLPRELNLAGYPGNRKGEMWWENDTVELVEPQYNSLFHMHTTFEGSSGSPMYAYDSVTDETRLYAVHTHGPDDLRRATLLTEQVVQRVNAAIEKAKRQALPGVFTIFEI